MKNSFQKNFYLIFVILLAILATVILVAVALSKGMEERTVNTDLAAYNATIDKGETIYTTEADTEVDVQEETVIIQKNTETQKKYTPTEDTKEATETTKAKNSTAENSTEKSTKVTMATAETQEDTASYQEQWDAGYLLALDYPDTRYRCRHVELSDETRAIVESLCMAHNEAGDFVGAALVAQSLKNAMVYHATDDIMALLDRLHITRERNSNVSKDVRDAVIYIFDMDMNAVQHRILYNYKPEDDKKLSEFHEGKEYVCTYKNIRFFDER